MSLKRQLLLASLLMLLIPWAGLRFVLELDSALRQQALQQLQAQGARLADVAGDRLLDTPPVATDQGAIYAGSTDQAITIDGYGHEWPGFDEGDQPAPPWQTAGTTSPPLRWQASHDDQFLYLLIQRLDQGLALYNPARPDQAHERIELCFRPPRPGNWAPTTRGGNAGLSVRWPPLVTYRCTGLSRHKPEITGYRPVGKTKAQAGTGT